MSAKTLGKKRIVNWRLLIEVADGLEKEAARLGLRSAPALVNHVMLRYLRGDPVRMLYGGAIRTGREDEQDREKRLEGKKRIVNWRLLIEVADGLEKEAARLGLRSAAALINFIFLKYLRGESIQKPGVFICPVEITP